MPTRRIACLAMLVALLAGPAVGFAQQSDDDALDRLLEQLEEQSKPNDPASGDEPKPGDVSSEDRQLDSLLEKLGGVTDEKPAPNGRPAMPAIGPDGQPLGPMPKGKSSARRNPTTRTSSATRRRTSTNTSSTSSAASATTSRSKTATRAVRWPRRSRRCRRSASDSPTPTPARKPARSRTRSSPNWIRSSNNSGRPAARDRASRR